MGLVLPPYSPPNCYKPLICGQWNLMASGPEAAFPGRKEGTEGLKQMFSPAALPHWPAVWPPQAHLSGSFSDVVGHTGHRDKRVGFPIAQLPQGHPPAGSFLCSLHRFACVIERPDTGQ